MPGSQEFNVSSLSVDLGEASTIWEERVEEEEIEKESRMEVVEKDNKEIQPLMGEKLLERLGQQQQS